MAQFNPIRPITQRLNTTSVEDLPRYASFLAASILSCATSLQDMENQKSDASVQTHKLTTRVSSLLQDKTQEGRFVGIVLVKALVEAVGPRFLATLAPTWVRGLLSCLNKQDPPQVKSLAVIVVSRLFLRSKGNQALVRETTTPSLPAFLTSCLNLIRPKSVSKDDVDRQILSPLIQPVLECWIHLLKAFPSTIRPFVPSIRAICLSLIGQPDVPAQTKKVTTQLFTTLHHCAPKDNPASEWNLSVQLVIEAIHQTADPLFRSVVEEWSLIMPRQAQKAIRKKATAQVQITDPDAIGMEKWTGVSFGCSRVVDLLRLLHSMLTSSHAQGVRIPITEVLDLMGRLSAVLCPTSSYTLRENKEIGREEREELYSNLPLIHSTMIELYRDLALTFGSVLLPVSRSILLQIWSTFDAECFDGHLRATTYTAIRALLEGDTVSMQSTDSDILAGLVRRACTDLRYSSTDQQNTQTGSTISVTKALTLIPQHESRSASLSEQRRSAIVESASLLLPVILSRVPAPVLATSTRTEIDRIAILLGDERILLASVLNPPPARKGGVSAPSILPFLARATVGGSAYEALLRPRMPVIRDDTETATIEDDIKKSGEATAHAGELDYATPLAIDDSAAAQMHHDVLTHEDQGASPIRKRDVTAVEETSTSSPGEPSKRVRLDGVGTPTDGNGALDANSWLSMSDNSIPIFVTKGGNSLPMNLSAAKSQPAEGASIDGSKTTVTKSSTKETIMEIDDDSDDSAIPEIDTALSSDEDDDEEE